ncbi:MAG: hypothetical protein NVS2B17_17960 [Candidatus Velthaea sp.]
MSTLRKAPDVKRISGLILSLGVVAGTSGLARADTLPFQAPGHVALLSHGLAASLHGKPVFARIHADWCSACKATQPTIDALRTKYGASVNFVEFDVTDAKTSAASAEKANHLGLSAFYEANKTATSTVAILNPNDGAVVAKFYNDSNSADYDRAIGRTRTQLHAK